MTRQRDLSDEVYTFVFQLLDAEPEFNGQDAGRIATHLQRELERKFKAQGRVR